MPVKTSLFAFLSSFAFVACCAAQDRPLPFEVGVEGGYPRLTKSAFGSIAADPSSKDTTLKGDYMTGVWVGYNTKGYYGVEVNYERSKAELSAFRRNTADSVTVTSTVTDRITVSNLHADFLVYMMPNGSKWRPYFAFGGQSINYGKPNISDWIDGRYRHYGVNWGGGIKLYPARHFFVRLDARDYIAGKPYNLNERVDGPAHLVEGSAGIGFSF